MYFSFPPKPPLLTWTWLEELTQHGVEAAATQLDAQGFLCRTNVSITKLTAGFEFGKNSFESGVCSILNCIIKGSGEKVGCF